ncbi:response regulator [Paenibacillus sp. GCM10027628]|uniref:response regulator transcription factor n=1 Tax=Paenibacillus sp. GCM10027628 TaxID=3273413 RepID=UPI003638152A
MLKVLIADDEPIMLEGLRFLIDWDKLGFEVCGEAMDGEDALQLMEECRPHLVITDIRMPVIDGLELIERAYISFPRTKFIVLSGYADFEYAKKAMKFGVSNYLTKPLNEVELENALLAAAESIRTEDARHQLRRSAMERIRSETILQLLLGDGKQERMEQAKSLLQLHEGSRIRCIRLIGKEAEAGEEKRHNLFLRLCEAAELAAVEEVAVHPFSLGKDRFGFVLASDRKGPALLPPLMNRFIRHIRNACGEPYSFSVSSEVRGAASLNKAYRETLVAELCKFSSDLTGVYYYQDCKQEESIRIPEEIKESLLQAIVCGNPDAVRTHARELFTTLTARQASGAWVEASLLTMKLDILQAMIQQGADSESWTRRWFAAPQQDPGGLESRAMKDFLDAAEWAARKKGANVDGIVSAAAGIIKQHYHEKLQLQHVAERLHVNPAYLGQRFKKHFGMAFNEYLHTVRIEQAKKLLRRAEFKIAEIASRVGYSDSDQFVAKFKALTGMIPSSYKKG